MNCDGAVACFMFDRLQNVVQDWEDTLKSKTFHPRIETALEKIPNAAATLRPDLLGLMAKMLQAAGL